MPAHAAAARLKGNSGRSLARSILIRLLYGKEEHSTPQIDSSALHDQIEDIVQKLVKEECLKM
jgi:hypothetical protein